MHGLGRVRMQGVDRCSHLVGRPGMVLMVPTSGKRKPAPTEARTSLMGMVKPVGAPFLEGSAERER